MDIQQNLDKEQENILQQIQLLLSNIKDRDAISKVDHLVSIHKKQIYDVINSESKINEIQQQINGLSKPINNNETNNISLNNTTPNKSDKLLQTPIKPQNEEDNSKMNIENTLIDTNQQQQLLLNSNNNKQSIQKKTIEQNDINNLNEQTNIMNESTIINTNIIKKSTENQLGDKVQQNIQNTQNTILLNQKQNKEVENIQIEKQNKNIDIQQYQIIVDESKQFGNFLNGISSTIQQVESFCKQLNVPINPLQQSITPSKIIIQPNQNITQIKKDSIINQVQIPQIQNQINQSHKLVENNGNNKENQAINAKRQRSSTADQEQSKQEPPIQKMNKPSQQEQQQNNNDKQQPKQNPIQVKQEENSKSPMIKIEEKIQYQQEQEQMNTKYIIYLTLEILPNKNNNKIEEFIPSYYIRGPQQLKIYKCCNDQSDYNKQNYYRSQYHGLCEAIQSLKNLKIPIDSLIYVYFQEQSFKIYLDTGIDRAKINKNILDNIVDKFKMKYKLISDISINKKL